LRVAGQDEDGRALFREHVIDSRGEELAVLTPPELRRRGGKPSDKRLNSERGAPLPCGCNLGRSPLHLCRTGAALNAALQLTETLAVAMPDDPLVRKLAGLCRECLMRHLMPCPRAAITRGPHGCSSDLPPPAKLADPMFKRLRLSPRDWSKPPVRRVLKWL
jgi:hypothetical protein